MSQRVGSEMSADRNFGHENGDIKKNADEAKSNKKGSQNETHENGEVRSRKHSKAPNKIKVDQKKPVLKIGSKSAITRKQQNSLVSKLLMAVTGATNAVHMSSWLLRLFLFVGVVGFAFATRWFNLTLPKHICWDETHFGKHANYYIKGEFFFDVHPPLAKMSIALAGYLSGYNGSFPFDKPGDQYGENQYVGMRLFCATLGALCVPLAYLTVWELTKSTGAAVLGTAFIVFDHGCITISQYILLDPILMFYIMLATYCFTKFQNCKDSPYSLGWWVWMTASGVSLSCAFSCKWVGLFVILWAGITTVINLWDLLGDLSLSLFEVGKHFMARVLCLIMVPVLVYLFWFAIHFYILPKTGPGDGFFSSAFQSTLKGNVLYKNTVPADLAFGSIVTIKNHRAGGALLHSHPHLYPKEHGPEQQQVTCYSHKDENNRWLIKKAYEDYDENQPLEFLKNGDWIRLEHVATKRNLHSHAEKAPLTTHHHQVTGYGENGKGDGNDFWRIEIVSGSESDGRIKTVKTMFRLIHVTLGCALHGSSQVLPKWGWEQLEVTCNPVSHHSSNLWNIEGHENERVPKATSDFYKPSFIGSVYESHIVMAQTNAGFKPKEGEVTSQPWQWPINYRGQVFSGADYRVYLLGNPVIWWFVLAAMCVFGILFCFHAVRTQRGLVDPPQEQARRKKMEGACGWLFLGWALHYFPFYAMGRVLYFHHYFPAYLYSAMMAGVLCQYFCKSFSMIPKLDKWKQMVYHGAICFLLGGCILSFWAFRGLSYGMSGPMAHLPDSTAPVYKWMDSWEV
ncbi:protein O-mannosyl-transferase 2-like isoform X1 [Acropora millepora]|uniref:protein O-mannosyl-transferase 2-like isoform X1 n=2 Tax=Acropora millepora TaxID=45264 RepID=UPI001CF1E59A|nr:protein O-mannosyl-transferase 2-like isoform X1 [Acropora millepora]